MGQEQLIQKMKAGGLIPVFNHHDVQIAMQVLDACYQGGVRVFEFTNRGDNALEVFEILVTYAEKYPDLILGIGTIFEIEQAKSFQSAGAKFIVSPAMIPELGEYCKSQNILWVPGCGTVTEIYQALQLGAKVIKAFPGNVLGPAFVSSVKAVYPNVPIMPTGGVAPTEENLRAWFKAGVSCVGMGSKLISKTMIKEQDFTSLRTAVEETKAIIDTIRSS